MLRYGNILSGYLYQGAFAAGPMPPERIGARRQRPCLQCVFSGNWLARLEKGLEVKAPGHINPEAGVAYWDRFDDRKSGRGKFAVDCHGKITRPAEVHFGDRR